MTFLTCFPSSTLKTVEVLLWQLPLMDSTYYGILPIKFNAPVLGILYHSKSNSNPENFPKRKWKKNCGPHIHRSIRVKLMSVLRAFLFITNFSVWRLSSTLMHINITLCSHLTGRLVHEYCVGIPLRTQTLLRTLFFSKLHFINFYC